MSEAVVAAAAVLRRALGGLDVSVLSGSDAAALVEALAMTEKACAGVRARAAVRAVAWGSHRSAGFRDPADWLAAAVGSSAGEAKSALATAEALGRCPATSAALGAGELSLAQAREITRTEVERPGSEAELVEVARRSSLGALRDEARRRRLAAVDVEDLYARQQRAREVRHWRDDLGMVCGRFALPPEVGVPFVNRLDAETDRIRRRARQRRSSGGVGSSGPLEPREAHAADAFAALLGVDAAGDAGFGTGAGTAAGTGTGAGTGIDGRSRTGDDGTGATASPRAGVGATVGVGGARPIGGPGAGRGAGGGVRRGRSADLVIVCDLGAWRRGHTHPGERCHVIGGTPIPVPVARKVADDAFLKAVLHDGTRIDTVVHYGRHIPAEVRTALELGPAPGFDGAVCVEPGCGRRHGLEWDHVNPVANRGPTAYANLAARCWPHHHDKTDRDRAAGLLGRTAFTASGAGPP